MCAILETTNEHPQAKESDGKIIGYKYYAVSTNKQGNKVLTSYYVPSNDTEYEVGQIYKSDIQIKGRERIVGVESGKEYYKNQWGSKKGFHMAMTLSDCISQIENKIKNFTNIVICKCSIPKGALYYEMTEAYPFKIDYSKLDTYVSSEIKIEKELFLLKGEDINKGKSETDYWTWH